MRRLLLISSLLLLGSCTLFSKSPATFDEYYKASVHASITSLEHRLEVLGLARSSRMTGIFDAAVSIPVLFSGSTEFSYDAQNHGRDASVMAEDGHLQYTGLAGSGSLTFDKFGLIAEKGNLHILYKNLQDIALMTPEMRTVFAKYDDTWLSWTQAEAEAGVTDPQELQVMTMTKNMAKIDIPKIEEYLTSYPIWKSKSDLGMSGSLHTYAVELDREKVITLIDTITSDLTGSGMTDEDRSSLRTELANVGLVGTMGFDPSDARVGQTRLTLSSTGGQVIGTLSSDTTSSSTDISLRDTASDTELVMNIATSETRDTIVTSLAQSGTSIGKLTGYIDHTGDNFRELSATFTASDITGTMRHTLRDDGTFDGTMVAPNIFSITWDGKIQKDALISLRSQGSSPLAGNYSLDLVESGALLRGPLVITVGDEPVMRANVGLIARHEEFRLVLDIPQGTDPTDIMHAEVGMTMKRSSPPDEIKAPSRTTRLQQLFDELQALVPPSFVEDTTLGGDSVQP